jgi:hypothetical protein
VIAKADLITGTLVTSTGQPVAFGNIDAKFVSGGGNPTLVNAGTNALGQFSTTIPAGMFELTFTPPQGVAGLLLTLDNVSVAGTVNLGTLALPPAFVVSGVCQNSAGSGVANVNLDVIDAGGNNIDLKYDSTDVLGNFALAVPPGPIELRFDASAIAGQSLASKALELNLASNTSIGTVTLPPGLTLAGIVKNSSAIAVFDADIDVFDGLGQKLYTPNDNTTASGTFIVKVPAGTYRVEICPPFANHLVSTAVPSVVVSGPTSLGTLTLQGGVVLSGTVKDQLNVAVPNADIDLYVAGTQTAVVLCDDNAASNGAYQVIAPLGSFDVVFTPPGYSLPLSKQHVNGVVISGNTVLNGVLPACPFSTSYGVGLAGTGGSIPLLSSVGGAPRVGNPGYAWRLSQGLGNSFGVLGVGFGQLALPLFGGTVWIDIFQPYTTFALFVGAAGTATKLLPVPITPGLVGISVDAQYFGLDAGAVQGISMSNGLQTTFCE